MNTETRNSARRKWIRRTTAALVMTAGLTAVTGALLTGYAAQSTSQSAAQDVAQSTAQDTAGMVDLTDPRSPAVQAHLNSMPISKPWQAAGMVDAQIEARKQGITGQFWDCPDGYRRYFDQNGEMLRDQLTPDFATYLDIDGVAQNPEDNNLPKVMMRYLSLGRRAIGYDKSSHVLEVWDHGKFLIRYMATSGAAEGDKEVQGDFKTPLGCFYIYNKHHSQELKGEMALNYPDIGDARRGYGLGLIDESTYRSILRANRNLEKPDGNTRLGGAIEVHGNGTLQDATRGCVAVTDLYSEDIYNFMQVGDRVLIVE